MGVSCIVDYIVGKIGLVSEQNVTNHMEVRINPMAQFQPATHVRRFKILGCGIDTFLLCVAFTRLLCMQHRNGQKFFLY